LVDALVARAARVAAPPRSVVGAVRLLEGAAGALRVDELAPTVGMTRQALELGFHDQAHLTRELRALTGRTPGEWAGAPDPG
jgi:hypothetical protein